MNRTSRNPQTHDSDNHLYPVFQHIRIHFYPHDNERLYHRDHQLLLYTLTWPAQWLRQRGLIMRSAQYTAMLMERLHDIQLHGDPLRYQGYFPRYLLKVLQQWMLHNGDDLYQRLRHASHAIEWIIQQIQAIQPVDDNAQASAHIEVLARTHALLGQHYRKKQATTPQPKQLNLF